MGSRRRVLHVVDSMKLGGVQTLLLSVLPRLSEHGIDCELAVLHGPGPFSEAFSARGITPIHLASSRWDPRIPWKIRELVGSRTPDILHAHGAPSCLFAEWTNAPRLLEHLHHIRGGGGIAQRVVEFFLYRRCDLLLACSRAALESVSTKVAAHVIYNGIDPDHFRPPDAPTRSDARARLGFQSEDFVLGMTGRITDNKGQRRVCEAFLACRERFPHLRVIIAGSGPDEVALKTWCAAHGLSDSVRFTGFQQHVLPVLHALDAYVMASEAEGFPVALLEAMGTGLPCLVSNFSSASEILVDGGNALVFDRDSTHSLVEAIADCVESPHKRLEWGACARERVRKNFTLDETVAQFAAAYRSVV